MLRRVEPETINQTYSGETALSAACRFVFVVCVCVFCQPFFFCFVAFAFDVFRVQQHSSALHVCVFPPFCLTFVSLSFSRKACVRLLLDSGADANAANLGGGTPLMAVLSGVYVSPALDCLSLLLEAGADPLAASSTGDSVLTVAARRGQLDRLTTLLAAEPMLATLPVLQHVDGEGLTALQLSQRHRSPLASRVLLEAQNSAVCGCSLIGGLFCLFDCPHVVVTCSNVL